MEIPRDIPDPAVMNMMEPQGMVCNEDVTREMMGILFDDMFFVKYLIEGGYKYKHNFRRVYAEMRDEGFKTLNEKIQARFVAVLGEKR